MSSQVALAPIKLPWVLSVIRRLEFPHKLGVCQRLFADRLAGYGICWVKTAPGPVWKLDLTNSTHRWIVYGQYEGPGFFKWMREHLPSDAVIIDSGANIGQMALYFGAYFPKGRVLAFEPGDYQADWLAECLSRNPGLPVQLWRKGLGEKEETMHLQLVGHSCSHGGQNIVTREAVGQAIEVVTLSHVLGSEKVKQVDLWKLDVEGFEIPALTGAIASLKAKKIRALWIETMGENGTRITKFMRDLGYGSFKLSGNGKPIPVRSQESGNTLFLPM